MKFAALLARLVLGAALLAFAPFSVHAQSDAIGVVVMHGKGGVPERHVTDLARGLEREGYRVANLEMPWSNRRNFQPPVASAEEDVARAIADMRAKGARKVFVAGHSLGGVYALYLGGRQPIDGVIAIAPGGSTGNAFYLSSIGAALERARQLVAEGKGNELATLQDFEPGRGNYAINTIPANFLAWQDPEGPLNMDRSVQAMKVPVLWVMPLRDYPGLRKTGPGVYSRLPRNALTRTYEPDADHLGAPTASLGEIVKWTREIAK